MTRFPLQTGASSLRNLIVGSALILPGLTLVVIGLAASEGLPLVAVLGLGMVVFSLVSLRNAWRERPSDLLFTGDEMRVEGGPLHRYAIRWDAMRDARLVPAEGAVAAKDAQLLVVVLADEGRSVLAQSDDAVEAISLRGVRDALLASIAGSADAPAKDEALARELAALRRQTSARKMTAWASFGLLFIWVLWPIAAIVEHRIDAPSPWSLYTLLTLFAVPLLLFTDGCLLVRAWMVDRRALGLLLATSETSEALAVRRAARRTWMLAVMATAPLVLLLPFAATRTSQHAMDEAASPLAHGFAANAPPLVLPPGTASPPSDAHDVQMIRTDHGAVLSYVVDTVAARAERGSTLFLDGKAILATKAGNLLRSPTFDKPAQRVAYTAVANDDSKKIKVLFVERRDTSDEGAQTVSEAGEGPAWSPAGDRLAYTALLPEGSRVGVIATPPLQMPPYPNSGFGSATWVTEPGDGGRSPAWSSDGSELAFASQRGLSSLAGGARQVFTVRASSLSGAERQLTTGRADCDALQWTEEGWIRFVADGHVQMVKP